MEHAPRLCRCTASQLSVLIRRREVSPLEVVNDCLARIEAVEGKVNAFITVLADEAREAARRAGEEIRNGRYRGPLHGLPVGLKDLFCTQGVRTTSGSRIFDACVPAVDSTVAARLKAAGAILLGKLNMNPLAYGPTTDGDGFDYGHVRNPWNPDCISGGSSGGSGAAVAAGQCTLAIGSDTGGSVRIPSALCGLAGLKPTYGRIGRFGLTDLSWSLDHAGPLARSVADCALALNALSGHDPRDPGSADREVPDFCSDLNRSLKGLRIGVPREYFEVPLDPQIEDAVRESFTVLRDLGAVVVEVSLPLYHYCETASSIILLAEATASHKELVQRHGAALFWPLRLRIEGGLFLPAADYLAAQRVRTMFCEQSTALMNRVDLLAGPTTAVTATPVGVLEVTAGSVPMGVIAAHTQYNAVYNLNGYPAATVPCGFSREGLPIGLQIAGRPFEEQTVLQAAHAYEQATGWHRREPPLE